VPEKHPERWEEGLRTEDKTEGGQETQTVMENKAWQEPRVKMC
jgi:hypothetical protein